MPPPAERREQVESMVPFAAGLPNSKSEPVSSTSVAGVPRVNVEGTAVAVPVFFPLEWTQWQVYIQRVQCQNL